MNSREKIVKNFEASIRWMTIFLFKNEPA